MSTNKLLISSIVISFSLSLLTIFLLFPDSIKILYTNIAGGTIEISWVFLLKVALILWWQTSVLWSIFYAIAKKMFIK